MPLARNALYAQNIEIFVNPTWDYGETCLATLRPPPYRGVISRLTFLIAIGSLSRVNGSMMATRS